MKQNILDVLRYIVEVYTQSHQDESHIDDIEAELNLVGFHQKHINRALEWLGKLHQLDTDDLLYQPQQQDYRIYTEQEKNRLTIGAQDFLQQLQNRRIITPALREVIIEQALALESNVIDADKMQWVSMMVLVNILDEVDAAELQALFFGDQMTIH